MSQPDSSNCTMTFSLRIVCNLLYVAGFCALQSCRVTSSVSTLEPDFYSIRSMNQPELRNEKHYVIDSGDTLQLLVKQIDKRQYVAPSTYKYWTFRRSEIDVDVFTLPFKIRPAQGLLPAQLNSNFNAALYVGRRVDLYNYRWQSVTPTFGVRQLRSRGFGYGFFAGIGSTSMTDFVTRSPIGIEYEGVVLDAGIATIYDARVFNVGLAFGIDYLADANRQHWIYQQKPWFGVLFGLNLN
ncbi:hypothetical protein IC229_11790 [Spirosoma sp. BT702]|uniref:Uncharacterized protein n=1 Tax=Spirosoma profusum TaxID=2771354 RepID=A0A927AQW1_9BACT|nr:hypothetical protein [Spirosoma profusum]MBD2701323.1 hypothetical protein [Spirosoma profusum]